MKLWVGSPVPHKLDMLVHTRNHSILLRWGQEDQKFKANLGYMRSCLKEQGKHENSTDVHTMTIPQDMAASTIEAAKGLR